MVFFSIVELECIVKKGLEIPLKRICLDLCRCSVRVPLQRDGRRCSGLNRIKIRSNQWGDHWFGSAMEGGFYTDIVTQL